MANHILRMAYQAARRHPQPARPVGGRSLCRIAGGIYGLAAGGEDFPTAPFFAVTVLVANYQIFSE